MRDSGVCQRTSDLGVQRPVSRDVGFRNRKNRGLMEPRGLEPHEKSTHRICRENAIEKALIGPKRLVTPATISCSLRVLYGELLGVLRTPDECYKSEAKPMVRPGPAFMTYARRDSRTRQLDDALSCLRVCRFIVGKLRGSNRQSGASHKIRARFETWPRFHDIRPKGLMNPATR